MLFVMYMFGVFILSLWVGGSQLWSLLYAILSVTVLFIYNDSDFTVFEILCHKHKLYPNNYGTIYMLQQKDKLNRYFSLCWVSYNIRNGQDDLNGLYRDFVSIKPWFVGGYLIIKNYQVASLVSVCISTAVSIMYDDLDLLCLVPCVTLFYVLTDIVLKSAIVWMFLKKRDKI